MGREVKTQEGTTKSLGVFVQCNPLAPESTSVPQFNPIAAYSTIAIHIVPHSLAAYTTYGPTF